MIPLDGGTQKIVVTSTQNPGTYLSHQYTEALNLTPIPTEWKESGRPIYNRLPAASQSYKLEFGYDPGKAYCFIPVGEGLTGSTSMVVESSGNGKFLTVQEGTIVWQFGSVKTSPVIIDLEQVGIGSAKYVIGYQLYYDNSPQTYSYSVENFSLNGQEMNILSSTDAVTGWRYSPGYAFLGDSEKYWSNYDNVFPSHTGNAYLSWETPYSYSLNTITLRCPPNSRSYGKALLYQLICKSTGSSGYCEDSSWQYVSSADIEEDNLGQLFSFQFDSPVSGNGWRVEWEDTSVSINNIYVSGVISTLSPPAVSVTKYSLVAYPANAVPNEIVTEEGNKVPLVMCKLALVDIDSSFTVQSLSDVRDVVHTKYEPIADWLTSFWDSNLIGLYDQVLHYDKQWMSPTLSMKQEYLSLPPFGIELT